LFTGCEASNNLATHKNDATVDSNESALLNIIAKEEKNNGIPDNMLNSIIAVESNHMPYVVNKSGKTYRFKSKENAANFIKSSVKEGSKNISVGCSQLHYKTHKRNFASVEDMLEPEKNISYAANLLKNLRNRYGSWEKATKMYHSSRENYNKAYYKKVMRQYLKTKSKDRKQTTHSI
jgi:soluble lytic murein transglycosylase-like protein